MRTFSLLLLLIWSHAGFASTALLDFSNSMYSFTADFTQTVYDSDSTVLQENKGQVKLVRPGKFRWTYSEPFKQVIVADGLSLWVYDEDIAQVTVRPQAETLGSAPIGLLSGQRAIQSEFEIVHLGNRDNLEWFQLDPLVKDTDFQRVFIAVDGGGLRAMELRDSFEQATQIRFSNFQKNVEVAAEEFVFTPPEGADVVGEMGTAPEEEGEVQEQPAETTEQAVQTPEQQTEQPVEQAEQAPQTMKSCLVVQRRLKHLILSKSLRKRPYLPLLKMWYRKASTVSLQKHRMMRAVSRKRIQLKLRVK